MFGTAVILSSQQLHDRALMIAGGCLLGTCICRQGKPHGLLIMHRTATRYASECYALSIKRADLHRWQVVCVAGHGTQPFVASCTATGEAILWLCDFSYAVRDVF